MGVLDDAIREHLELKRKHGATEDEVQRQEEEALGPARRDVAQQHEGDHEPAAAGDEAALFDGEEPAVEDPAVAGSPEPELEPTALHEPPAAAPTSVEPPPVEPPPGEPPADLHAEPHPVTEEHPPPAEEPAAEPPSLAEEPPVAGQPPVGQEPDIGSHEPVEEDDEDTAARDARLGDTQPHGFDALDDEDEPDEDEPDEDELLASDPEHEEQDVLEDTPDFLQETPEHDRLWFEQKPPRDFDFD